ncbi:MAG: sulfate permease [Nevskia sp.]|nr:sulfate permease [Nevskia sp.]
MRLAGLASVTGGDLSRDLIAGAVTAVLLVPQALAYALLAGLPPEAGLYAAMLPALFYACTGTSPALSVGPVAVVSLMTATSLAPLAAQGSAAYWQDALILALLAGVMLSGLGLLRLGLLTGFLSYPVMSGFAMGAAVLIVLSQLPQILGLRLNAAGDAASQTLHLLQALPQTSITPLAVGALSIAALLLARNALPRWLTAAGLPEPVTATACRTMPLLLVLATSLGAAHLPLHGSLQLVGRLATGLPRLAPPPLDWNRWRALLGPAALIGLVGYLEGISIAQVLARRHRHEVKANRELAAIGLANLAAAFTQGMPVAGSLSRSVVNDAAGARSRLAGVVAAVLVIASSVVLAPLLETLPRAVLAAIIVVAVLRLLDWRSLLRVWRYDRADGLAWAVTTAGVLAVGAEIGFVAGLAMSLLLYIWRTANPHIVEVGHVPNSNLWVETDRHHDLELWPQLLLVRIDESLFFGNAAAVQTFVMDKLGKRPEVSDVILICSAVNAVDASALQMLEDLCESLGQGGVTVHLAEVKGPLRDRLEHTRLFELLGRQRLHASVATAISALASPPI